VPGFHVRSLYIGGSFKNQLEFAFCLCHKIDMNYVALILLSKNCQAFMADIGVAFLLLLGLSGGCRVR